jgi:hypothetical protein
VEEECEGGWNRIVLREKFGGCCFYVNRKSYAILQSMGIAAEESLRTCEVCGQPGRQRGEERSIRTLCDLHIRGRGAHLKARTPV